MGIQGPNRGQTAINDPDILVSNSTNWINPENAALPDHIYATATLGSSPLNTVNLAVTDFGFSIPSTARIDGIKVDVRRLCDGSGNAIDNGIELKLGTNYSDGGSTFPTVSWPTVETYRSYGGNGFLWELAPGDFPLTPTDVNSSSFGVSMGAHRTSGTPTVSLDHIQMTIFYSMPRSIAYPTSKKHIKVGDGESSSGFGGGL